MHKRSVSALTSLETDLLCTSVGVSWLLTFVDGIATRHKLVDKESWWVGHVIQAKRVKGPVLPVNRRNRSWKRKEDSVKRTRAHEERERRDKRKSLAYEGKPVECT